MADPYAPPFVLEATRKLAVDHINRYQEVFQSVTPAYPQSNAAADEDTRVLRTIVKGKLILDLKELLGDISALEESLLTERKHLWIQQGLYAVTSAVALDLVLRKVASESLHRWLSFVYYPVALYKIWRFEHSISNTTCVRQAFERILDTAQEERQLQQSDVDYVTGSKWDTVPWKESASSIYFPG